MTEDTAIDREATPEEVEAERRKRTADDLRRLARMIESGRFPMEDKRDLYVSVMMDKYNVDHERRADFLHRLVAAIGEVKVGDSLGIGTSASGSVGTISVRYNI